MNLRRAHFDSRSHRHLFGIDAVADHVVMFESDLIVHGGLMEKFGSPRRRRGITIGRIISHAPDGDEGVLTGAQAKIKGGSHGVAPMLEANSGHKVCRRRQWRPAAVICRVPPTHPGRSPNMVRPPAPAAVFVIEPAAIMKRRPAPGIVGPPIPSAICVDPAAAIKVRLPAMVSHANCRLPATPGSGDINPTAIRSQ